MVFCFGRSEPQQVALFALEIKMPRKLKTFREYLTETLRDHPEETLAYLQETLAECEINGNWRAFLRALRTAVESHGGIGQLAEKTGLSRQNLYRILEGGNPTFESLISILGALGFRLALAPKASAAPEVRLNT
jgi:probable addiction module antidote protein